MRWAMCDMRTRRSYRRGAARAFCYYGWNVKCIYLYTRIWYVCMFVVRTLLCWVRVAQCAQRVDYVLRAQNIYVICNAYIFSSEARNSATHVQTKRLEAISDALGPHDIHATILTIYARCIWNRADAEKVAHIHTRAKHMTCELGVCRSTTEILWGEPRTQHDPEAHKPLVSGIVCCDALYVYDWMCVWCVLFRCRRCRSRWFDYACPSL